jgi:DNA processing protein
MTAASEITGAGNLSPGVRGVPDDERLALAALTRIVEPGDTSICAAVEKHGAVSVFEGIVDASLDCGQLAHYRTRLQGLDAERDLRLAARQGVRFLCPGDLEWPSQLGDLGPKRPLALWVRGEAALRLAALRSVAIVGARAATGYGEHVAADISAALGERGWTVVSGGAFGVDAAAHRGALATGAVTIAVLACGVDVAYPRAHDGLLRRIASEGLVVSEVAPGCAVTRLRFLERNRVIAALTRGTVVVEAAVRSGALNTAGHANKICRPVMAVPGPVTSASSAGCHAMIRAQRAVLVSDAADVLDVVGQMGIDAVEEPRGPESVRDGLDHETLRVLDALPAQRLSGLDALSRVAGLDIATVLRGLTRLSGLGLAEQHTSGWRLTPAARAAQPR